MLVGDFLKQTTSRRAWSGEFAVTERTVCDKKWCFSHQGITSCSAAFLQMIENLIACGTLVAKPARFL
jgi:hypothetical protein